MKKSLKKFFLIPMLIACLSLICVPVYAADYNEPLQPSTGFTIVDGNMFISVTEDQFNEFDAKTDLPTFMRKHKLTARKAVVMPTENEKHMNISATRASVNLSAHTIPGRTTMFYYQSNGSNFPISAGSTFTIEVTKATVEAMYIGYNDGSNNYITGTAKTQKESFKFSSAIPNGVKGCARSAVTSDTESTQILSGKITW